MGTIVVSGAIANKAGNAGATWTRLSWVLGLRKLGWTVIFVEQITPERCTDSEGRVVPWQDSVNLAWFLQTAGEFGTAHSAALLLDDGRSITGPALGELIDIAGDAALLVNISGHLRLPSLFSRFRKKLFVDLDPGFTQFWQEVGESASILGHDAYASVGANIGRPSCAIPTLGLRWMPVLQPCVLESWPVVATAPPLRFTTVASWRGPFGSVTRAGLAYGLKVHEFRRFLDLPLRVGATLELAIDLHPADGRDLDALRAHGWNVVSPHKVAAHPTQFREYIQGSSAEFSVAQGIYVDTGSGWFSDRSARYLCSGKPVVVQDTGWSQNLPTGAGLFAFKTTEEAVTAIAELVGNYDFHARAARAVAEEYFDSDKVLSGLLDALRVNP